MASGGSPNRNRFASPTNAEFCRVRTIFQIFGLYSRIGPLFRPLASDPQQQSAGYPTAALDPKGAGGVFMGKTTVPVLVRGRGRTKTGQLWAYEADDRSWGGSDPLRGLRRRARLTSELPQRSRSTFLKCRALCRALQSRPRHLPAERRLRDDPQRCLRSSSLTRRPSRVFTMALRKFV
jgi:hypothetical protein